MTSINTNQSSMVALDTLRNINTKLSTLNDQISTGKVINNAKDNASIWSIAKTMDSDVMAFGAVSNSLALASSTIGVARKASESVTDLLSEVKKLVTQSSNKNTDDREKIGADIKNLTNQITDIVQSAQFNGVSLLDDTTEVNYLSSFNRDSEGGVASDTITVSRQDLRVGDPGKVVENGNAVTDPTGLTGVTFTTLALDSSATASGVALAIEENNSLSLGDNIVVDLGTGNQVSYTVTQADVDAENTSASVIDNIIAAAGSIAGTTLTRTQDGTTERLSVEVANVAAPADGTGATAGGLTGVTFATAAVTDGNTGAVVSIAGGNSVTEGDYLEVTIGGQAFSYVVTAEDAAANNTEERVLNGLVASNTNAIPNGTLAVAENAGTWELRLTAAGGNVTPTGGQGEEAGSSATTLAVENGAADEAVVTGLIEAGGLGALADLSVSDEKKTSEALTTIESLIKVAKDASAAFGSAERRVDIQKKFVTNLTDSLKLGISTLTDADLSAASAELSALQVRQQLSLQSLSIANQGPQTILSLFR